MSDSDSTWTEDETLENQDSAALGDALSSLEEQLQEHQPEDESPELGDALENALAEEAPAEEEAEEAPAEEAADEAVDVATGEADEDTATESFEDYPVYDEEEVEEVAEAVEEAAAETEEVVEEAAAEVAEEIEEAPAVAATAAFVGQDAPTGDFNLTTLTQLVDEIRQESQRVTEMKDSVNKALALIQEMSESLQS